MPKAYSEKEREYIRQSLKKEALDCLIQFGVRKTTVDELVRRVNIPKGTFYLFYPSKEILLFDALNEVHDEIHKSLLRDLEAMKGAATVDDTVDRIYEYFVRIDENQLTSILVHGDFELLLRKLPKEEVEKHFLKDQMSMEQLISYFPGAEKKPLKIYECAIRAVFMTVLHKREIGEEHYYEAVRVMLKGIVEQMIAPVRR